VSVVVIGLNHRTVPIGLLERFAVTPGEHSKVLHDLCSRPNVTEAVVLSTCNRTEVYAVAERFHGAYGDIRDALCRLGDVRADEIAEHLYSDHDDGAVGHLFAVASGIESDVLGETEILGQVRSAWDVARDDGSARAALNLLFRHAIEVGKRARTETAISRSTSSVSHAAVDMARDRIGDLAGRRAVVIGAGEMGEGIVRSLAGAGVEIVIANRTFERGEHLATQFAGRAVTLHDLGHEVRAADLVLTSAPGLSAAHVAGRADRPLLLIDIAVPRSVAVADVAGVTVLDLDDLREWADRGRAERRTEVDAVRSIIAAEVARYNELVIGRQAAPLIAQLHERAASVRSGELARFEHRLQALSDRDRELVEQITRSIEAKLLHPLTQRLRDDAGTPRGERNAAALRDFFDLP
jgi:glutamyl-tRNA reductase